MKSLKEFINEGKITSIDDEAKDLAGRVAFKYKIKRPADRECVIDAVNKICLMCKDWKEPYPTIHDFIYDEDELEATENKYKDPELNEILIDHELLSVEINGYGNYKWNNMSKKWIKY